MKPDRATLRLFEKSSILIAGFDKDQREQGMSVMDAAHVVTAELRQAVRLPTRWPATRSSCATVLKNPSPVRIPAGVKRYLILRAGQRYTARQ